MARILMVDDDPEITDAFGEILRVAGHEVRTANSGEEGLRALTAVPLPDIVVLDVDMAPGMSGPAMAHEMLLHDAGQEDIPVVLMSGNCELEQIARRMGTPYCLAKPADSSSLLELCDRAQVERKCPSSA